MRKLSYRFYRFASALQYNLQRRFTRSGWLLIAAFLLTFGLVMDTEHSAAYQLLGVTSCLLLGGMIWAPFFRGSFAAIRVLPRFATVEQTIAYSVSVTNLNAKPYAGLQLLENLEDARATYAQFRAEPRRRIGHRARTQEVSVGLLPSHRAVEARLELTPLRRGLLRFEGLTVARPDPLGLFRGFLTVPAPQTLTVLPRRYALPKVTLPGTARYQHGGVALAGSIGESNEFLSLREYRRGDPLRHIHWKSSARAGELIVKDFQDEFFVRHALILDTFAGPEKSDEFEEAVSIAASFASTVETQESLLDLMFVGPRAFCFTVGRGVAHTEQMLEILATVQRASGQQFASLHHLVLQHATGLSGCVCIFVAWDQARQQLIAHLRQLGLPVIVLIVVGADESTQLDPGPLKNDPASLHLLRAGKIGEDLQKIG